MRRSWAAGTLRCLFCLNCAGFKTDTATGATTCTKCAAGKHSTTQHSTAQQELSLTTALQGITQVSPLASCVLSANPMRAVPRLLRAGTVSTVPRADYTTCTRCPGGLVGSAVMLCQLDMPWMRLCGSRPRDYSAC